MVKELQRHRRQQPLNAKLKTRQGPIRFLVAIFFSSLCWGRQFRLLSVYNDLSSSQSPPSAKLPACTEEASFWPQPSSITPYKYQTVLQAEMILRFISTKLNAINAPFSLMYGTALHEYRNGTTDCVRPKYWDKDIDMAVFPEHYPYVIALANEIRQTFGWEFIEHHERERLYSYIRPAHLVGRLGNYMQIDIYGFLCDPQEDVIFFPWDTIAIAKSAFLPLKKHKLILPMNDTEKEFGTSDPGFFMPYNPPCLFENLYGSDYMTPKVGKSTQAKYGTHYGGRPAFNNPKCNSTLTMEEQLELEHQLEFCSGGVPKSFQTASGNELQLSRK